MQLKIEELDSLREEVNNLSKLVLHLTSTMGLKKTVSVKDIAEMEGVSVSSLRGNCRYLLPNCGQSQYPDGPTRWDIEVYLSWRSLSPTQRKSALRSALRK